MISGEKLQRLILALLAFAFVLYFGDYAVLKMRGANGTGSVVITQGTPMKDGRVEIFTGDDNTVTCVHSLFPHSGFNPCWYVEQNRMQLIGAQSLPPAPLLNPKS